MNWHIEYLILPATGALFGWWVYAKGFDDATRLCDEHWKEELRIEKDKNTLLVNQILDEHEEDLMRLYESMRKPDTPAN